VQVCNSPDILNFGTENVIFIEMKHGNITGPRHAPSKSNTEILACQLTAGMLESLSEPSRSACRVSSALPLCVTCVLGIARTTSSNKMGARNTLLLMHAYLPGTWLHRAESFRNWEPLGWSRSSSSFVEAKGSLPSSRAGHYSVQDESSAHPHILSL
jgi:hypothetical protein